MAERRSFFSRLFTGVANLFRGRAAPPSTPIAEEDLAGGVAEQGYIEPDVFPEPEEPYEGTYPPEGMYIVQGNADYWHTRAFWFNEVTTKDADTLEAEYGVTNIAIIRMLESQGAWISGEGSPDWRAFRDEYFRNFGYTMQKYSPAYGR